MQWMLERERKGKGGEAGDSKVPLSPQPLQLECPLWKAREDLCGKPFYLNVFSGQVSRQSFPQPPLVDGGILADEMGLGKTVEVLACILSNRKKSAVKKEETEYNAAGDGKGTAQGEETTTTWKCYAGIADGFLSRKRVTRRLSMCRGTMSAEHVPGKAS